MKRKEELIKDVIQGDVKGKKLKDKMDQFYKE